MTGYHLPRDVLRNLPFGTHSHWLQPWRAASDTVPAGVVGHGCGVGLDNIESPMRAGTASLLAQAGFRLVRLEIGWGDVDFESESRLLSADSVRSTLWECRAVGLRPLILLNAHHGRPVPARMFPVRLASPADKGIYSIRLTSTAGIVSGRSGLCGLTGDGVMASVLVSAVSGKQVQLTKRLPVSLGAGQVLTMATLRYAPFSTPGSPDNEATMTGWLRYVDLVADVVGVGNAADRGFDLEVWNELTFGSNFLSLANYQEADPATSARDDSPIWDEIVSRTAAHVAAHPARFAGVSLSNGFGSTIPWTASSKQPARVSAISKHPYPPRKQFPVDETAGFDLGPDGQPTRFVPSYAAFFPEYFATAIQTETLWRDISPDPNPIYGTEHGRLARPGADGAALPVSVWITELGVDPSELGVTDLPAADRLRTKYCLRSLLFYLGIGVSRVYLFRAFGNGTDFGMIINTVNGSAPPALTGTLPAIARALRTVTDGALFMGPARPLRFELLSGQAESEVFSGTADVAPLRELDCLVLLPFQSSEQRIVIACYIMTRDVRVAAGRQDVRVIIHGMGGDRLTARLFDPVNNWFVPCPVFERSTESVGVQLAVTDTPRLLVLHK